MGNNRETSGGQAAHRQVGDKEETTGSQAGNKWETSGSGRQVRQAQDKWGQKGENRRQEVTSGRKVGDKVGDNWKTRGKQEGDDRGRQVGESWEAKGGQVGDKLDKKSESQMGQGRQKMANHPQTQRLKPNMHCCWEHLQLKFDRNSASKRPSQAADRHQRQIRASKAWGPSQEDHHNINQTEFKGLWITFDDFGTIRISLEHQPNTNLTSEHEHNELTQHFTTCHNPVGKWQRSAVKCWISPCLRAFWKSTP